MTNLKMNYAEIPQQLTQELLLIIFKQKVLVNILKVMVCPMDLFVLIINNQIINVLIMKLDFVALNNNINVNNKIGLLGLIEMLLLDMVILKL